MLRRTKRWLNKNYPLQHPSRIVWATSDKFKQIHDSDCYGDARFQNGKFLIRLNRSLKPDQIVTTLIHEHCHCLTWHLPERLFKGNHDEIFALIHTRILNDYLGQD